MQPPVHCTAAAPLGGGHRSAGTLLKSLGDRGRRQHGRRRDSAWDGCFLPGLGGAALGTTRAARTTAVWFRDGTWRVTSRGGSVAQHLPAVTSGRDIQWHWTRWNGPQCQPGEPQSLKQDGRYVSRETVEAISRTGPATHPGWMPACGDLRGVSSGGAAIESANAPASLLPSPGRPTHFSHSDEPQ